MAGSPPKARGGRNMSKGSKARHVNVGSDGSPLAKRSKADRKLAKEAAAVSAPSSDAAAQEFINNAEMNIYSPHGVYAVRPKNSNSENMGECAGYLGCRNIGELWDVFWYGRDVLQSLYQWQAVSFYPANSPGRGIRLRSAMG
jgi:hypothetical protein